MEYKWNKEERRRFIRIEKHFIISYYDKSDPEIRHNVSQLKNISLGGMCFITSTKYEGGKKIGIDLRTPYVVESVHIDGTVLGSHEKVPKIIYETRLAFDALSNEAEIVLTKIVETFSKILREKKL